MLALFLFEIVEEDVDESAAAVVEDIEVLTALDKAAVAAVASAERPCERLVFSYACSQLTSQVEKQDGDSSSSVSPHCHEESKDC
jgi:hypothetical protein